MKNLILIRHPKNWGFDEEEVRRITKEVLAEMGFLSGVELSFWFVGRERARQLNIKYRKMGYIPQVLGFPMEVAAQIDGLIRLGDVVICSQKLKKEARLFKKGEPEVMREWIKHGIGNLLKG